MERDGYYITTAICISVGLVVLVAYIVPTARKLQGVFACSACRPKLIHPCSLTFDQVADRHMKIKSNDTSVSPGNEDGEIWLARRTWPNHFYAAAWIFEVRVDSHPLFLVPAPN
jgi:Acetyl-coenzyme A transporter 1